ncbi:MAG: hypothetical protein ACFE9D_07970 [Promethearchaeota archaeon]
MTQPPQTPPPAAQKGGIDQELKRIVSYISHLNEAQKKMAAQITNIEKRIDALDKAIGNIMTATGKAVADGLAPIEAKLSEVIDKSIRSAMTEQIIPQLKRAAPAPASAQTPAPARAPAPAPAPAPTPVSAGPAAPRRPSDVPDTKIAMVIEVNDNIINDLKSRQKVQREYLKPLIEQARDTAMNNLSSRAKAASVYKELIALLKSSPSDLPPDTVATAVARLEELNMHIRSG